MQTTTKRTFAATSPTTGEVFTRQSERDYTYAVIYMASAEREQAYADRMAKEYLLWAQESIQQAVALEASTTPNATDRFGWSAEAHRKESEERKKNAERYMNMKCGIREAVTFHHTEALARKAANGNGSGNYDLITVVPCTILERKPKGSKAAWNC